MAWHEKRDMLSAYRGGGGNEMAAAMANINNQRRGIKAAGEGK